MKIASPAFIRFTFNNKLLIGTTNRSVPSFPGLANQPGLCMNDFHAQELFNNDIDTVIVLLVDDQPLIVEAVRRDLASESDIKLYYCDDANQAVMEAEKIRPTVILQDLVMPGLDGLSLIKEYRKNPRTQGIPVVALSTKEDPNVKKRAFEVGASDYLVKLPDPIELIARVRYHSRSFNTTKHLEQTYRALRTSQQQLLDTNLVLQRMNSALQRQANSDGMTGLSNRRHFDEFLSREWQRACEAGSEISLLMVDVDFFKLYNDKFGHSAGDDALKNVAAAMRDTIVDETYFPARYGGEEFAIVLPGVSQLQTMEIAENLRKNIEALNIPHVSPRLDSVITVSIGLATLVPTVSENSKVLIELADKGLYLAKNRGRNQIAIFGK